MKSKDVVNMTRENLIKQFNQALESEDTQAISLAFADMAQGIQEEILEKAKGFLNVEQLDAQALTSRGLRQLTSEEKNYYNKMIKAMKSDDPKQALKSIDVTMPKTIIDDVFEELQKEHELLSAINFQNTSGVIEWIVSKNGKQKAKWGAITAEITKELEGKFEKVSTTLLSLTAFLPVAKSMLDLGPVWLDRYVREILKEAIYVGLEEGIVMGDGLEMPIGMMKDLDASKAPEEAYKDKKALAVTDLSPKTFGEVISKIAVDKDLRPRKVEDLIMIVNPIDYFKKVMPATTILRPDGTYANNVLPYPASIIQCEEVPEGKCIVGLGKKYFMGIGTSSEGVIEYDDSFKFLQRERTYAAFLYGNGKPQDNNAFQVLDITGLKAKVYPETSNDGAEVAGKKWTESELNKLTVEKIDGLAAYYGYTLSGGNKAEKIASFLEKQSA